MFVRTEKKKNIYTTSGKYFSNAAPVKLSLFVLVNLGGGEPYDKFNVYRVTTKTENEKHKKKK